MSELPKTEQSDSLPTLYACHRCQRIGPKVVAVAHQLATGHVSELVSDAVAEGVREVWAREGRSLVDGEGEGYRP